MECAQLLVDYGGVYHENFAEYAAVRIQSLWKGFVVRKRFKKVIAEAAVCILKHHVDLISAPVGTA